MPPTEPLRSLETVRSTLKRSAYIFSEFPLAMLRFLVIFGMLSIGGSTLIIGFGLLLIALALFVAGGFARIDRMRLTWVQGWPARRPAYKKRREGLNGAIDVFTDVQRWREAINALIGWVVAFPLWAIALIWWTMAIFGTFSFLYVWSFPSDYSGLAELFGWGHSVILDGIVNTVLGLVFLVTLPVVMRGLTAVNASLSRVLLTSEDMDELRGRVSSITESRDAAVSAEASALRRLERDIHDGPQQRLVRLAMDLSTAQRRMDSDPQSARPMLDEAILQTRETLDELRALSRGIAPPILADRGLAAALAAVAGRSPIPVDLSIDDGVRLPTQVENTAYFVVTEALTNVAKHSAASSCSVSVTRGGPNGTLVQVMVTDDGVGGAHPAKGRGLAGLADRVRGVDGRFEVESPAGGPTIVVAEIPCAS